MNRLEGFFHTQTFRKPADAGPSFSETLSSCSTFSRPLLTDCISSAKDFS
jgi:hypothetical protein